MSSNGDNTFKNGNTLGLGRQKYSQNKALMEIQKIGEENCLSLYEMQMKIAETGDREETRSQAQQFLLNKVLPNAKGSKVYIQMKEMNSIEDIRENENAVIQAVASSTISVEDGEKLLAMTEQVRKTIEATEIAKALENMQERMKEAGI